MKVKFSNTWYGPKGRYRIGEQEVPDEYADLLPSSAEVLEEPKQAKKAPAKKAAE